MPTAFVLSSGGAKGAFGAGALVLLERKGIKPDIICATSAGSLNGLKIAEGPGAATMLLKTWRGLQEPADMFQDEPWFAEAKRSLGEMAAVGAASIPMLVASPWIMVLALLKIAHDGYDLYSAASTAKSFLNLNPVKDRLFPPQFWLSKNLRPGIEMIKSGTNANGLIEYFALRADGRIETSKEITSRGPVTGWSILVPGFRVPLADFSVSFAGDGKTEIAARGRDRNVYLFSRAAGSTLWFRTGAFGGLTDHAPVFVSSDKEKKTYIFANLENELHYAARDYGTTWGSARWKIFGSGNFGPPVVERNYDGRIEVFCRNRAAGVMHRWQTSHGDFWSQWHSLGGRATGDTPPAVMINSDGRLEVFIRTSSTEIRNKWQVSAGSGWTAEWNVIGTISDASPISSQASLTPVCAMDSIGKLHLWMIGPGDKVFHVNQVKPNGSWTAWSRFPSQFTPEPEPATPFRSVSVSKSGDGRMVVTAFNGSGWAFNIAHPVHVDVERIIRSGIRLRLSVVSLESGLLSYVTEQGYMLPPGKVNPTGAEPKVHVITAAIASGSIPVAFPPVKMGSENFIDGGVRESAPLQAAYEMGADKVYLIVLSPSHVEKSEESYDGKFLDEIGPRSLEILTTEVESGDVDRLSPPGVSTIVMRPRFHMGTAISVHYALVSIALEYGYMIALGQVGLDETNGTFESLLHAFSLEAAHELSELRYKCWKLEEELFSISLAGGVSGSSEGSGRSGASLLGEIRDLKKEINGLVRGRQDLHPSGVQPFLVDDPTIYFLGWENHKIAADFGVGSPWAAQPWIGMPGETPPP